MARWSYLLLASLTILGVHAESSVLDLIPKNFDQVVLKSKTPGLVEFFAPWCGHCKNLAPIYEELGKAFAHSDKVHVSKVDADEHKALGKRFNVQGFPTLLWFNGKSDKPETYEGARQFDDLAAFITKKTGIRPKVQKETTHVEMLNDKTFYDAIGGHKDVFVAFTAPWCGHCKTLAPIWEKLAETFNNREPNVMIAKVDAEAGNSKSVAKQERIQGYPTIRFYPRKSIEFKEYGRERSEEAFVEYLNEMSGTSRAVGGGLTPKAGTIEKLNTLVDKFVGGEKIAKVAKEIEKAAKGLEDKYAAYYVKAAGKLKDNADYATKELARLERMLGKGNLAGEKMDDLQSRSNILRRFLGIKTEEPEATEEKTGKDEL